MPRFKLYDRSCFQFMNDFVFVVNQAEFVYLNRMGEEAFNLVPQDDDVLGKMPRLLSKDGIFLYYMSIIFILLNCTLYKCQLFRYGPLCLHATLTFALARTPNANPPSEAQKVAPPCPFL